MLLVAGAGMVTTTGGRCSTGFSGSFSVCFFSVLQANAANKTKK
jgi:hypothetical protein